MPTNTDPTAPKHGKPPERAPKKKTATIVVLVVVLVALVCGIAAAGWKLAQQNAQLEEAAQEAQESPDAQAVQENPTPETNEEEDLPENPVDFATLQAENSDIYAWIYVPNTNVNYPVLQSATDDLYYLNNNRYHEWSVEGALFTQSMNSKDFADPVTVIYGHNNSAGAMFATLHNFEDPAFFDENAYFYVYTPSSILTYEIVSAYEYDNRHIMNSFDFQDTSVLLSYYDAVLNPTSVVKNVREGVTLDADDRIVQLSTCVNGTGEVVNRYIVTGVLIDEQPTA